MLALCHPPHASHPSRGVQDGAFASVWVGDLLDQLIWGRNYKCQLPCRNQRLVLGPGLDWWRSAVDLCVSRNGNPQHIFRPLQLYLTATRHQRPFSFWVRSCGLLEGPTPPRWVCTPIQRLLFNEHSAAGLRLWVKTWPALSSPFTVIYHNPSVCVVFPRLHTHLVSRRMQDNETHAGLDVAAQTGTGGFHLICTGPFNMNKPH